MLKKLNGIVVTGTLLLGVVSFFTNISMADEDMDASLGITPIAQQLREKEEQKAKESTNKWDNTKNYMKRGFKGSCTTDCVENKKLCDDKEKQAWCKKNCEGKYKIVKTGKFFEMEQKCPSTLIGKAEKTFKNPFGK